MKNISLSLMDTNSKFFNRQPLRIPNKIMAFKNFSNQRLIEKVTPRSKWQTNGKSKITQRIIPFVLNKKQDTNRKHILSYDDFIQTKNTFARILKYTTLTSESTTPKSYKMRKLTLSRRIKTPLSTEANEQSNLLKHFENSNTGWISNSLQFKRDMEEKFECTRLMFREENRLKNINKLNSIRRKRKDIHSLNKSEEISSMMQSSSREKYSPWVNKRRMSRDIYEVEESREGEDLL